MTLRQILITAFLTVLTGCKSSGGSPAFDFGAYSEAEQFYEKREYSQAIEKYEEYLRQEPQGNMALIARYYLARSYEAAGETGKALEIYRQIASEHPDLNWGNFSKIRISELEAGTPAQQAS